MEPGADYLNSGLMMPTFVIVLALISKLRSESLLTISIG
jgi:hypothetical protein